MKLSAFLKDRAAAYAIFAAALALSVIFMLAFKAQAQSIAIVSLILFMAVLLHEAQEFSRKKPFYDRLGNALQELDKKYLLPEMLREPDFYEGRLIYEAILDCDKSMSENIASYRRQSREFREYIEIWVHEAKLPLSSLLLMCHNNPETTDKMTGELKRLDAYIENVLYYARSENAEKDYIIKESSLRRVFSSVAVKNREALQLCGFAITASDLDTSVMTDAKWLEFMLGQLMSNSLKYFSKNRPPRIEIYAEENSEKTLLHFKDNGIGIPEADLPYIFEKSYTGQNGRGASRSTGMGLYIVKNLCLRLGHSIEARSRSGEYTDIIIGFAKNDFYKMS